MGTGRSSKIKSVMTFGTAWPIKYSSRLVQWPGTVGSQADWIGEHANMAANDIDRNQHATSTATAARAIRKDLTGPNIR